MAITQLIKKLAEVYPSTTQCWYADNDGAGDDLVALRRYWDELDAVGQGYGYFPKASKTVLLPRPGLEEQAIQLFVSTGVAICSCGSSYLGGALGDEEFRDSFMAAV